MASSFGTYQKLAILDARNGLVMTVFSDDDEMFLYLLNNRSEEMLRGLSRRVDAILEDRARMEATPQSNEEG